MSSIKKIMQESTLSLLQNRRKLFLTLSFLTASYSITIASVSHAADLHPVILHVGAKEYVSKSPCLSDGQEVYVPLDVLKSVGGEYRLHKSGDSVFFKPAHSAHEFELGVARPKGEPMIVLADAARCLQAAIIKPPVSGQNPASETVCLLASILNVKVQNGGLNITTSFPVPYHVHMLSENRPVRGYVDVDGTVIPDKFKPDSLPILEKVGKRISIAQNSVEVSRVVVELSDGAAFDSGEYSKNSSLQIAVLAQKSKQHFSDKPKSDLDAKPTAAIAAKLPDTKSITSPELKGVDAPTKGALPRTQITGSLDDPAPLVTAPSGAGADLSNPDHSPANPASSTAAAGNPNSAESIRGKRPSRGGKSRLDSVLPVDIHNLVLRAESDRLMRLDIATSGRSAAFMHYSPDSSQLIVDVPNATLRLNSADAMEQQTNHPLITGLHASQVQLSPPMVRIALDMSRVIGFSVSQFNDRLSVELRLPTNATGALADKLIVIDPGHGGSSSGALGRGEGVFYEKDVTLALALKLRKDLEECGARVVMTRDSDIDVPLYDRPRLANQIGADLFISIHNDSNGRSNSASGTSTYYHLGDPNSRALAACVQKEVVAVSGLPSRGVLSDGIMYHNGFAVLRVSKMPAVLCEVAYINNSRDRAALTSSEFQLRVAHAMCEGLRNYVEGNPRTASILPVKPAKTIRVASEPETADPAIQLPVSLEK